MMLNRFCRVLVVAAAALLFAGSAASAAILTSTGGATKVNGKAVGTITTVVTGDRIQVGQGGSATLVFDNGCSLVVEGGKTYVVDAVPACTPRRDVPRHTNHSAPHHGVGGNHFLIIGGAALAIGGVVAIAGKKKSVSP